MAADALQKFGGLLHDGQVRAVGGVVDLVEAEAVEHRHKAAHVVFARIEPQHVADGDADGRGHLRHDIGVGVRQLLHHERDGGVDRDGAGGTYHAALAAVDAVALPQVFAKGRGHDGLGAALGDVDGADLLDIVAHAHAVAAEDALVGVAHNRRGAAVHGKVAAVVFEAHFLDAEAAGQVLKLAFAGAQTGGAVAVMAGQHQF